MDPITQRILDQQKAITQDSNFTGYQPSVPADGIAAFNTTPVNQDIMFQDTLVQDNPPIDMKGMAINVGKKMVTDYAIKKLGLEGLKGNLLKSAVGSNLIGLNNPLSAAFTVGSLLPDSVKGIAGLLRGKRAEKAIAKDIIADSQGFKDTTISPKIINMQPTGRDKGMGSGGKPTGPSKSPSKSYSGANPYGGGAGGLHSGY
jgi:hypothetical protein